MQEHSFIFSFLVQRQSHYREGLWGWCEIPVPLPSLEQNALIFKWLRSGVQTSPFSIVESKVVYCLTFSQELLPEPSGTSQRQGIARSVPSSSDRRDLERLPVQERAMSRPLRNSRFSFEADELLLQLKGEGLSWDEISDRASHSFSTIVLPDILKFWSSEN